VKVEIRLFATLAPFLPPNSVAGAAVVSVPEGGTVAEIAERLGIPAALPRIALVNGEDAAPDRRLAAGDVVALFPPLAGG
jgi:molybdopterin converting factor small subunit